MPVDPKHVHRLVRRAEGSTVAAPTFGLPEEIGGERNWDYRYTWIRDTSFALYAFSRLGYTEEMAHFTDWIVARCTECAEGNGQLQVLYDLDGKQELPEVTLSLRRLQGLQAGSYRQRRGDSASARHLRRAHGCDLPVQQNKYGELISYHLWQKLVPTFRRYPYLFRNKKLHIVVQGARARADGAP